VGRVGSITHASNRSILIMTIMGVIAVSSFSYYAIASQLEDNQEDERIDSKLDYVITKVNQTLQGNVTVLQNPSNVTIVVPTDEFLEGNISGLDKSFIIKQIT
jgi:hypothetical protein